MKVNSYSFLALLHLGFILSIKKFQIYNEAMYSSINNYKTFLDSDREHFAGRNDNMVTPYCKISQLVNKFKSMRVSSAIDDKRLFPTTLWNNFSQHDEPITARHVHDPIDIAILCHDHICPIRHGICMSSDNCVTWVYVRKIYQSLTCLTTGGIWQRSDASWLPWTAANH